MRNKANKIMKIEIGRSIQTVEKDNEVFEFTVRGSPYDVSLLYMLFKDSLSGPPLHYFNWVLRYIWSGDETWEA